MACYTVTLTLDNGSQLDAVLGTLYGPDSLVGTAVTDTITITPSAE